MIKKTDIAIKSMLAEHTGECTGIDAYTVDVHFKVYNITPGALSESLAEIIARVEGEKECEDSQEDLEEIQKRNEYIARHFFEICEKADGNLGFVDYDSICVDVGRKILHIYKASKEIGLL